MGMTIALGKAELKLVSQWDFQGADGIRVIYRNNYGDEQGDERRMYTY
jgi:hypothetical protein